MSHNYQRIKSPYQSTNRTFLNSNGGYSTNQNRSYQNNQYRNNPNVRYSSDSNQRYSHTSAKYQLKMNKINLSRIDHFARKDLLETMMYVKYNSQANARRRHCTHELCQIDYTRGQQETPSTNNAMAIRAYNANGVPVSPIICGSSYRHPTIDEDQRFKLHSQRFVLTALFKNLELPIKDRNINTLRFIDQQDNSFEQVSKIYKNRYKYKKKLQQQLLTVVFVSDYSACPECKQFLEQVLPKNRKQNHQYHYLVQQIGTDKSNEYSCLLDHFFSFIDSDDSDHEQLQHAELKKPSLINEQIKKYELIQKNKVQILIKFTEFGDYGQIVQKLEKISEHQKSRFLNKLIQTGYLVQEGTVTYSQNGKLYETIIIQIKDSSQLQQSEFSQSQDSSQIQKTIENVASEIKKIMKQIRKK